MEYRSSEVKAGFFIFVSLVALISMIFLLGNVKDYFKPKKTLEIVFGFTGGLEVGAAVRYAGLDVGRVVDIKLHDSGTDKEMDNVVVITEIVPSIVVKQNSSAMIKTSGLMGSLYIDIRPGTSKAEVLAEGQPLMGQDSFEFAKIGDMMGEVVRQTQRFTEMADSLAKDSRETLVAVQESLGNVNQLIASSRGDFGQSMKNLLTISNELVSLIDNHKEDIKNAIVHTSSLTEKSDEIITAKKASLEKIIDQTDKLTGEMELLLSENRAGVTHLVSSLEEGTQKITTNVEDASGELKKTLRQSNAILTENRRSLLELIRDLKETSGNLKVFSDDLKRNPWKLVRKSDELPPKADIPSTSTPVELKMKRLDKVSRQ